MATKQNTPAPQTPAEPQKPTPKEPMARDEHTGKAGRYVRDKATGQRRPA